jgi:putative flippase GtrA
MTKRPSPKNPIRNKKVRFVIVGGANTVIDFAFYNLFSKVFGLALPVANMVSSFIAMLFSFFMNKKWTFQSAGKNYLREVGLFFTFTIIGIWVIQSGTIWLIENTFSSVDWQNFWLKNILKAIASVPSLIWNYITYNKFVFRDKD